MKYMGSKSRIVDNILPIIKERLRDYNIKTYIEPFCGGCNVIDKVQCNIKIASDNHKYVHRCNFTIIDSNLIAK